MSQKSHCRHLEKKVRQLQLENQDKVTEAAALDSKNNQLKFPRLQNLDYSTKKR